MRGDEEAHRTRATGVDARVTTRKRARRDGWKIVRDVTAFARVVAVVVIGMGGGTARAWRVPEGGAGRAMKKRACTLPKPLSGRWRMIYRIIGGTEAAFQSGVT